MNSLTPLSNPGVTSFSGMVWSGSTGTLGSASQRCCGAEQASSLPPEMMAMQQSMMTMMLQLMTLLLQLMAGKGGSSTAASPLSSTAGGSSASSGGGSTSGTSAGFDTPGQQADASDFQGGTEIGRRLAAAALKESTDGDSNGGLCARDVRTAMEAVGIHVERGDAWTKAAALAKNPRFKEIKVSKSQLDNLPPGAVVVWDKGNGMPYGHVSIALGDGREASDRLRKQSHYSTSFRVFMPIK